MIRVKFQMAIVLGLLFLSSNLLAKITDSELLKVEQNYQRAKSLKINLTKSVTLMALGRKELSEGELLVLKPKNFRLNFLKPEKNSVISNGKTFWVVEPPFMDGGALRIMVSNKLSNLQSLALRTFLTSEDRFSKHFDVTETKSLPGQAKEWTLVPSIKQDGFTKVRLQVDLKSSEIRALTYWDELENEVKFDFIKVELNAKIDKKQFDYVVPKGADVTDLDAAQSAKGNKKNE